MRKDFIISDGSVVAIEDDGKELKFLKVLSDGSGMQRVPYGIFMEYWKHLAYVCCTSWNRDLPNKYYEFDKVISKAIGDAIKRGDDVNFMY